MCELRDYIPTSDGICRLYKYMGTGQRARCRCTLRLQESWQRGRQSEPDAHGLESAWHMQLPLLLEIGQTFRCYCTVSDLFNDISMTIFASKCISSQK